MTISDIMTTFLKRVHSHTVRLDRHPLLLGDYLLAADRQATTLKATARGGPSRRARRLSNRKADADLPASGAESESDDDEPAPRLREPVRRLHGLVPM